MKYLLIVTLMLCPLLVGGAEITVGYLGITGKEITPAMQVALGIDHGVLVDVVNPNAPAESAGVLVGDVILEIDGEKVVSFDGLRDLVEARPGKTVPIKIFRQARFLVKNVTLGTQEKNRFKFQIDIPDLEEISRIMDQSTDEMKEQIKTLQEQLEELRKEIEALKQQAQ